MPSSSRRVRGDAGMATAELAACLPVLMVVLAVALTGVSVAAARVRVQDAAREAARAAARGDTGTATQLAHRAAPGAAVSVRTAGDDAVADVRATVHPLGSFLPAFTVTAQAVAAVEPKAASP
jgi:Flp pilus assembly protein TadG